MDKKNTFRILKGIGRFFSEVIYNIIFIVVLVAIIRTFIISPFSVHGSSMDPTLYDGEFIIVKKFGEPQRGDVVVFQPPLTKRDEPKFETTITTNQQGEAIYEAGELRTIKGTSYCQSQFLEKFWFCKRKLESGDWIYIIPKEDDSLVDSTENLEKRRITEEEAKSGSIEIYGQPEQAYFVTIFAFQGEDHFVKRVIGQEGDTVRIENGKVYLKKADEDTFIEINEPYLSEENRNHTLFQTPPESNEFLVPEDHYFLLGDNRRNSNDSRSFERPYNFEPVPFIHKDHISGKVLFVLLPILDLRWIESAEY